MRQGKVLVASVCVGALSFGCSAMQRTFTTNWKTAAEPTAVTVRFVSPPDYNYANNDQWSPDSRLVRGNTGSVVSTGFADDTDVYGGPQTPAHVVLWGGDFNGNDVTYFPAQLKPGPYMFGMFDPGNGAAYQGWISVNTNGDDVVGSLTEWRDTVHEQQEWLAWQYKMTGQYEGWEHKWFNNFRKELRNLKSLEAKIQNTIVAEQKDRLYRQQEWHQVLSDAQVLLMPSQAGYFTPSTKAAFNPDDLDTVQHGEAITKVVLVGNFDRSKEKLNRVLDLQDDLYGTRNVFEEEMHRLENRRHYYRLTDHLYHHGNKFVENEAQLQQVRSIINKIDRQITDYRRYCHALLFVTGLFAPDETFDAFDQQENALRRDRVVWQERKHQLDMQFNDLNEDSPRRVYMERERQNVIGQIERIDSQIDKISETRVAVNTLRDHTEVIHRHGPSQVIAATVMGSQIPAMFANAVEEQSLMTVRLQSADKMFMPPSTVTKVRSKFIDDEVFLGPTGSNFFPCED